MELESGKKMSNPDDNLSGTTTNDPLRELGLGGSHVVQSQ